MSILEIIQIEQYVPKTVTRYRYPGRKPLDRKACARAFVAKALYRYPTTSDLIRALQSAENLRRLCGFTTCERVFLRSLRFRELLPNFLPVILVVGFTIHWYKNILQMNLLVT